MNAVVLSRSAIASLLALALVVAPGCAVGVGGYGDGYADPVTIGVDYYAPFGVDYGGWGPGYRVGPYRGGGPHMERAGGRPFPRGFWPAAAGRAVPSIPQHPRGGDRRPR